MQPTTLQAYTLDRPGCHIHYWMAGPADRPLVVFTHAATIDHHEFDGVLSLVAADYRVLAWDVRGHGLSHPGGSFTVNACVDDLVALLDQLDIAQAVFVGHSLGGNITQELVFRYPQRATALVMLGCTCNTFALSGVEKASVAVAPAMFALYPYDLLKRQSARASAITPAVQQYLYETFSHMTKQEFVTVLIEGMKCLHAEPGYRIMQPMLLAHGDQDGTGNIRAVAPRWAAREPDCRYAVIPNAGHMANLDNAAVFNKLLLDFLHEQLR